MLSLRRPLTSPENEQPHPKNEESNSGFGVPWSKVIIKEVVYEEKEIAPGRFVVKRRLREVPPEER